MEYIPTWDGDWSKSTRKRPICFGHLTISSADSYLLFVCVNYLIYLWFNCLKGNSILPDNWIFPVVLSFYRAQTPFVQNSIFAWRQKTWVINFISQVSSEFFQPAWWELPLAFYLKIEWLSYSYFQIFGYLHPGSNVQILINLFPVSSTTLTFLQSMLKNVECWVINYKNDINST